MRIYYKTFGCRVNQIESQSILEKFSENGYEVSENQELADIVFVNTCCVTEKADSDVLHFIKKLSKKKNVRIIVTGCYASLFPEKIKEINSNIEVFNNKEKEKIVSKITGRNIDSDFFMVKGFYGRTRAFVKIQDGCDLKCSYCIVPYGRSELKSKKSQDVISEVKNIISRGYKEIVLSGTRLGYYKCPEKKYDLKNLLSELFSLDADFRIRLSSLEPMEISVNLLELVKSAGDKFCEYFHLPVQSANNRVLKYMKRPYDKRFLEDIVCLIKKYFENVGLFCDIISAFPMESDEDFNETYEFIKWHHFSGIHNFTYSKRPLVEAQKYGDLPYSVKLYRSKKMMELDRELRKNFAKSLIGRKQRVLTMAEKDNFIVALTSNFQKVFLDKKLKRNCFYDVYISKYEANRLLGVLC